MILQIDARHPQRSVRKVRTKREKFEQKVHRKTHENANHKYYNTTIKIREKSSNKKRKVRTKKVHRKTHENANHKYYNTTIKNGEWGRVLFH